MAADSFADEILDELLPESLDWRHLMERYPRACLATAVAAGFLFGRRYGGLVVAAVGSYVAAQVGESVADVLGE
jgi:hypothetical protein